MLFNSLEFLTFFAVFLALWTRVRRTRSSRWLALTAASLFFYGWWDWRFVFLLVGNGLIDYFAALGIAAAPRRKRLLLGLSILGNVGSLAVFKYLDFGIESTNAALSMAGRQAQIPLAHLPLPVGISFYTFQSMSYTLDVYRGRLTPVKNLFHYFSFLAMFPQLVAGPIVRAADLLPQLAEDRPSTAEDRWEGLKLIVHGYLKKVVIADSLAPVVNSAFGAPEPADSALYWWMVMTMFAFQIYGDFSGYSDIARGLGRWMGFRFPLNFNHPYIATSIRDFWARWHISLSTWFRDYVYIPLGGSRHGLWLHHRNMWITMLVSGIWHGAAWTFVIWAALHSFFMSIEQTTRWPERLERVPGGRTLSALIVFTMALTAWVFFRAESFDQALVILSTMFPPGHLGLELVAETLSSSVGMTAMIALSVAAAREIYFFIGLDRLPQPTLIRQTQPALVAALIVFCIFFRGPGSAFIYFQF